MDYRPFLRKKIEVNPYSPQARGLVAWLPPINPVRDAAYRNVAVSVTGATPVNYPTAGTLYDFSGSAQYITFDKIHTGYALSTAGTIACWLEADSLENDNWAVQLAANSDAGYIGIRTNYGSLDAMQQDGGYGQSSTFFTGVSTGALYHLAMTWQASGLVAYVNGKQASSSGAITATGNLTLATIGASRQWGAGNYFNGRVGGVRIYNRVLSAAEIWALYAPATRYDLYLRRRPLVVSVAAGGTAYNQSASGALTPTGITARLTGKLYAGAITPAGAIIKRTAKTFAGAIAAAGGTGKQTTKSFSGGLTPTAALATTKTALLAIAGAITPAGAIIKRTTKTFAGGFAPAGLAVKQAAKSFGGSLTPAGAISTVKTFLRAIGGSLTPAGNLTRLSAKTLGGGLTAAGAILKSVRRSLSGSINLAGALDATRTALLSVGGLLTPAGAMVRATSKTLGGSLPTAGSINRAISRALAGALSLAGALAQVLNVLLAKCDVSTATAAVYNCTITTATVSAVAITTATVNNLSVATSTR